MTEIISVMMAGWGGGTTLMYEYGCTLGRSHRPYGIEKGIQYQHFTLIYGRFCNVISHKMSMVITIYSRENSLK